MPPSTTSSPAPTEWNQIKDDDLVRCRELQDRYRNLVLGVVDASVLCLVARLGETTLAKLDRRHFATVRPAHAPL